MFGALSIQCLSLSLSLSNHRGLAGTTLVLKAVCASAAQGTLLPHLTELAQSLIASVSTAGACLFSCALPGQEATFSLGDDEIEVGLGIHVRLCIANIGVEEVVIHVFAFVC